MAIFPMMTGSPAVVRPPAFWTPEVEDPFVEADEVFAALDGLETVVDDQPYQLEIFSVYDRAGIRWVQLAVAGAATRIVTLQVRVTDSAAAVRGEVEDWIRAERAAEGDSAIW
jgi:hypothetical protein